jgi:hypothetical protein
MKSILSALLSLPLLIDAVAVGDRLNARQLNFDMIYGGPAKIPVATTKATPQLDSKAIRETVRWGPFYLNAANVSLNQQFHKVRALLKCSNRAPTTMAL